MMIKTENELFNTIIGGGYKDQKTYLLIISSKLKGMVNDIKVLPKPEKIDMYKALVYENVTNGHDVHDIVNSARLLNKPAIIVNYVNEDEYNVAGGWTLYTKVDHAIIITPNGEDSNGIRIEVVKQREEIRHSLQYPFIYNMEENEPHI